MVLRPSPETRAHKPLHLREQEAGAFSLELNVADARTFGIAESCLADRDPLRPVVLSTGTGQGPTLTADEYAQPMVVSMAEALAYAHQIGRQLGLGDHVRAYTAIHRRDDAGGLETAPKMYPYLRLKEHALVRVGVGDLVRWGTGTVVHVGRVKSLDEGGRVALVRLRGSDARMPVPVYDLSVILAAPSPQPPAASPKRATP